MGAADGAGELAALRDERDALAVEVARLRGLLAQPETSQLAGPAWSTPAMRDVLFAAVEKTRMPMIVTDPNLPDDPIIFVNRAFQELSGYSAESLVGRNCRFLQGPDTDPEQVVAIRAALAEQREIAVEILNYRIDGTPFWNELYISPVFGTGGEVLYHFGSQVDVSSHRQARQSLARSEARYQAIFDGAVDFAIVATDSSSLVTNWNVGAERILGWSASEMIGEPVDRIFVPEDREAGRAELEMGRARESGWASDERWHLRKDGSRFWASGEMLPLRGEAGRVDGFLKILRDRTAERARDEALAETETRFRTLVEVSPQVVFFADATGCVTYCNPFWHAYTGLDHDETIGDGWIRAYPPERRPAVMEAWRLAVQTGERYEVEMPLRRARDGADRWFLVRGEPVRDAAGRITSWIGVAIDIDERRAAEAQHAFLLALAATLLALSEPRAIMDAAAAALRNHLDVDHVGYGELAGTVAAEASGAGARAALLRGETVVVPAAAARGAPTRPAAIHVPLLRDGALRAILQVRSNARQSFRPDEVVLVEEVAARTWDALVRARAEDALRELNSSLERQVAERTRELEAMWRTSRDLLCVADFNGNFLNLNPAWATTLGWSTEALRARPFLHLVHPEDRAATITILHGLERGEEVVGFENRYRSRDGTIRWLSWNAVPRDGLVYAVVRDVTVERAQGEALRATEDALRQAQKMEAVGQLTGGIAHDFNNLLTGIVGSLDLLQTRLGQGRIDTLERYAKAAMTSANRAAALTHRLLAFARRQPLEPRPVAVNDLVASLEDLLRRTLGEAVALTIRPEPELWPTLCDPNQLESAILNLAINARDAMPDGGSLTIETCNTHLGADIAPRHPGVTAGDYVALAVGDTGTGMTPDVIARAFDPFFTTKPLGQGTGLGLSMIYGFARQSEGHAAIRSESGQGTIVTLYLPRHRGEAVPLPEPDGFDPSRRAGDGETVLVVEDEAVVRNLIVEVLHDLGYRALQAGDGAAGLRLLQAPGRIDLLITDVGLPGLNGRQLADQARETRPGLKVLFITGYAENATFGENHLAPGMQMITKPFPVETLAARIREMIETPTA